MIRPVDFELVPPGRRGVNDAELRQWAVANGLLNEEDYEVMRSLLPRPDVIDESEDEDVEQKVLTDIRRQVKCLCVVRWCQANGFDPFDVEIIERLAGLRPSRHELYVKGRFNLQ